MKPSTMLYIAGGLLYAIDLFAGFKTASLTAELPAWYPQALAQINEASPVNVAYILLGAGVVAHYNGY
jgi:hypothetical protein